MKKNLYVFITALLALFSYSTVFAQSNQLKLRLTRDWGYGGLNGDIEGLFSMKVSGPPNIERVEYFIDDVKIGEVTQVPFTFQFKTEDHAFGVHELYAIGFSADGVVLNSNTITANFVPKQSATRAILPVLGVIIGAVLISTFAPLLVRRGKRVVLPLGAERKYGVGGGGICPNCRRPFALPIISLRLGFSKVAACPFCGRVSIVRMESMAQLRTAELAELDLQSPQKPLGTSEEEKLRKDLDDSRYQSP